PRGCSPATSGVVRCACAPGAKRSIGTARTTLDSILMTISLSRVLARRERHLRAILAKAHVEHAGEVAHDLFRGLVVEGGGYRNRSDAAIGELDLQVVPASQLTEHAGEGNRVEADPSSSPGEVVVHVCTVRFRDLAGGSLLAHVVGVDDRSVV